MSWLFGKKKHHRESLSDSQEESSAGPAQTDDYIIVEKEENPQSPTSGGLYPSLADYPSTTPQHHNVSSDSLGYLSGIPFKLSKSFNNDFEIEKIKLDEITSFVHRIINQDYDYEFRVERSVINEMESGIE